MILDRQLRYPDPMLPRINLTPTSLSTVLIWGWCLVILLAFFPGYLGENWTTVLSFSVSDGWCQPGDGFGAHCWGDFGLPYYKGFQEMVYVQGNIAAANNPLMVLLFQPLALLPYNLALSLFLSAMAIGVVTTAYWGAAKSPALNRALAVFAGGLGSVGVIMGLDRGNWVLFVVPLLLIYCIALIRGKTGVAIGALVLIASLKFWGIVFVIGLLASRRYRAALVSIVLSALANVIPLAVLPGALIPKFDAMLEAVTDRGYGSFVSRVAVSLYGLVVRTNCAPRNFEDCNRASPASSLPYSTLIAICLAIGLCVWAYAMLRRYQGRDNFLAYSPMISLAFLAVPEAAGYNLAVVVTMIALLNRYGSPELMTPRTRVLQSISGSFLVAIALTSLPLPIWMFPDPESLGFASRLGLWRLYQFTVPISWSLVVAVTSLHLFKSMKVKARQGLDDDSHTKPSQT